MYCIPSVARGHLSLPPVHSELGLSLSFGVEVFEPGHRTPLHVHPGAHELFFVLSGSPFLPSLFDLKPWLMADAVLVLIESISSSTQAAGMLTVTAYTRR